MSRFAFDAASVTSLRPASKIGKVTPGANYQPRESTSNQLLSAGLARPNIAVSEISGKNASRAAPMLALAAFSACSACNQFEGAKPGVEPAFRQR